MTRGEQQTEFLESPAVSLILHIIRQAVMDYALGKHSHNHNPKSMRRIHRTGEDAGRFLFSPYGYSLERLLRVTQLDSSINLNRVRQMAEKAETPQYNTLVERGKR